MEKIKFTQEQTLKIIDMYYKDSLGTHTISKQIGVGKQVILNLLKENGIELRGSGRQYEGGKSVSDKRYYSKNKEKRLKYFSDWGKENRDYLREYHSKWREKNKEHLRETRNKYERNRKHNDPMYKLIANFRTALCTVLKENNLTKCGHYFEILGYSPEDLKQHLDGLLTDGMTWENYGEWHVDHIIPITSFNFTSVYDEEFKKCWSLSNLQPMWGEDNIRKSNKVL